VDVELEEELGASITEALPELYDLRGLDTPVEPEELLPLL